MRRALDHLKREIASFELVPEIDEATYLEFVDNCTVALTAGGEGSRLRALAESQGVNKASLLLPDGDTMVQRTIRMYRDAGFPHFVALVFHEADSVIDLLGDGAELGVSVTYSHDPGKPVGKGGAVRNALDNGSIPRSRSLIVHNPDDQIVDYPGSFPGDIVRGHLAGLGRGMLATAVVVEETPYAYTGMKVRDGVIEEIEMYPHIPVPTHIGVTLFSPEVYGYFERLFDLTGKADFESVLFPVLSAERRLYATQISSDCWIPVNDLKSMRQLIERL